LHDPRHGPALGLFERSEYPTCQCPLVTGDQIFLYTDGIYEATNPEGDEFGQKRLFEAVRSRIQLPTERLFDEVLAEARNFSGVEEFEDDVCLVGLEAVRIGQH
jgi:sigma-B regulation protein RsbU (phosphoserine phosphatase)